LIGHDPDKPHRKSTRLKGYDYSQAGAYFVTICTQGRACLFGDAVNDGIRLNALGEIVEREWLRTVEIRPRVQVDAFVVMPNHMHGILIIRPAGGVGATRRVAPTRTPRGPAPGSIGAIVGQFKSRTTKHINRLRRTPGMAVWQRNYYEHVIRNDESLNRVRQYILDNPVRWTVDRENPATAVPEAEDPWS
jgi:putative transposase